LLAPGLAGSLAALLADLAAGPIEGEEDLEEEDTFLRLLLKERKHGTKQRALAATTAGEGIRFGHAYT